MKTSPDTSIGELVKQNFKTASIFQENNTDFCCGGNKFISEVCCDADLNSDQLISKLKAITEKINPGSQIHLV